MLSPVEGTALALLTSTTPSTPLQSIYIENASINSLPLSSSPSSLSASLIINNNSNYLYTNIEYKEFLLSIILNQLITQYNIILKQHIIILRPKDDLQYNEDDTIFIILAINNQCILYQIEWNINVLSTTTIKNIELTSTINSVTKNHNTLPYNLKLIRNFYVGGDIVILKNIEGSNGAFLLATGTTVHQYTLLRSTSSTSSSTLLPDKNNISPQKDNNEVGFNNTYDICHAGIWTTPPDVLSSGRITSILCSPDARYISVICGDCLVILYHEITIPSYAYIPLMDTSHHNTNNITNNANNNSMNSGASLSNITIFGSRNRSSSSSSANSVTYTTIPKLTSIILQHENTIQSMEWKIDPTVVTSTEVSVAIGTGTYDGKNKIGINHNSNNINKPSSIQYTGGFIGSLTWAAHTNRSPYPLPYGVSSNPALLLVTTKDGNSYLWRENDPWNTVNFTQIVTFIPPTIHGTTGNNTHEHSHTASTHNLLRTMSISSMGNPSISLTPSIQRNWTWMRHVIGHDRVHWAWNESVKPNILPDSFHSTRISSSDKVSTVGRNRAGSAGTVLNTFHPTLTRTRSRMTNRTLSIMGLFSSNKDLQNTHNLKMTTDDNSNTDPGLVFYPPLPHVQNHHTISSDNSSETNATVNSNTTLPGTHITPLPRKMFINSSIKEEKIQKNGEILEEIEEENENMANSPVSKNVELSFRLRSNTIDYVPSFVWPSCGHDFHLNATSGSSNSSSVNTSPNSSGKFTMDGIRTSLNVNSSSTNNNTTDANNNTLLRRNNDAVLGILNELPSRATTLDSEYVVNCQATLYDHTTLANITIKETSQKNVLHPTINDHSNVRIGLHRVHGAMEGFENDIHVSEVALCHFPLTELHSKLSDFINTKYTIPVDSICPLIHTNTISMYEATTIHDARVAGSVAPSLAPAFPSVRSFDRSAADSFRLLGNTVDPSSDTNTTIVPSESVITDLASVATTINNATTEAPKFRTRVASAMATAAVCDAIDTMVDAVCLYDGRNSASRTNDVDVFTQGRNNPNPTILHQLELKRSVPLRKVRRNINRGLNIRNRINRMPQVSYVTLLVQGNIYKVNNPNEIFTAWSALVELTVEWGTSHSHSIITRYHILKFLPVIPITVTDFTKPNSPNPLFPNTTILSQWTSIPDTPSYHPLFLKLSLEQGRNDVTGRSFAHIAWCIRRTLMWQESVKYVLQKAKKKENHEQDHSEQWANIIADSLSTEKDLTKIEDNKKLSDDAEEIDEEDNIQVASTVISSSTILNVSVPELPLSLLFSSNTDTSNADTSIINKYMEIKPIVKESLRNLRLWYTKYPFTIQLIPSSTILQDVPYPPPLSVADIDLLREYLPTVSISNLTKSEQNDLRIMLDAYINSNGPTLAMAGGTLTTPIDVSTKSNLTGIPSSSSTASVDPAGKVALISAVIADAGRKLTTSNAPHTPLPVGMINNSNSSTDNNSPNTVLSTVENIVETIPWSACVTALISDSQDALLRTLLPPDTGVTWTDVAALKIPLWLRNDRELADIVERVGKTAFIAAGKDPYATVLPYLALGISKVSLVRNFFRLSPTHAKVYTFLSNDFTQDRWKQAASKNAFALLAAHRYEAAAGFFLLAGKPGQAVRVLVQQRREPFMALAVARLAIFNGSVAIPPVSTPNPASSSTSPISSLAVALASTSYGNYDATQILKDATAEILAEARAKQQNNSNIIGIMGSASTISGTKSTPTKSILGFGFDDDNDYVPPVSVSSITYVDGLPVRKPDLDDDTVYRPSTSTNVANVSTSIPTASTNGSSGNLRMSTRPDADIDPIGWILDSEFKALVEGKSTYACEDNGKVNPITNTVTNILDNDSTKALEFILLWLTKKPMDAMTELLTYIAKTDTVLTDHRLPISASLLLDMPIWKRPQILKVLLSRLRKRVTINSTVADDNTYVSLLKGQLVLQETLAIGMEGGRTSILFSSSLSKILPLIQGIDTKNKTDMQLFGAHVLLTLNGYVSSILDTSLDIPNTENAIKNGLQIFWNDVGILRTLCTGMNNIDKSTESSTYLDLCQKYNYSYANMVLSWENHYSNTDELRTLFNNIIDNALLESNEIIQTSANNVAVCEFLQDVQINDTIKQFEDKHIQSSLNCLRLAKLIILFGSNFDIILNKKSVLFTHAWVHAMFIAYNRHDWNQVIELLRLGSGSYKGHKQSKVLALTLNSHHAFMIPSFVTNLYKTYWLHSCDLKLPTVRSNGYFFIGSTLRPLVISLNVPTENKSNSTNLTIKTNPLQSTATASSSTTITGNESKPLPKSHHIVSLEEWLTRYISAAAGALLALQIQNVLYDSARETLPLLDSWLQRCAVIVASAHSSFQYSSQTQNHDSDLNIPFIWSENNGTRAHIVSGLTGIPDTRTSMIAHGFDWESTQQAKEQATNQSTNTNNRRKGNNNTGTNAMGTGSVRRRDSISKATTHDPSNRNTQENSSAWWADVSSLLSSYVSSNKISNKNEEPAIITLWKYLGGPGLLWMIGTERRALVRARARARSGFLPSVRSTDKLEIRGKSILPVLQFSIFTPSGSLNEFTSGISTLNNTASPSYIRAGINSPGRFILVAVEGTSMNTVVVGVGRLMNNMDPFQIVPLSTGTNKTAVNMVTNPIRLLNGIVTNNINNNNFTGLLANLPSNGINNLHNLANNVTNTHVKQLLSGSLVRRGSTNVGNTNNTVNGESPSVDHEHKGSTEEKTIVTQVQPLVHQEPAHHASLFSRVRSLKFLGGKKAEIVHEPDTSHMNPKPTSSNQTIVPVVLRQDAVNDGVGHQDSGDFLHRSTNVDGSSFQIDVAPLPDSLYNTLKATENTLVRPPIPNMKAPPIPPLATTQSQDGNKSHPTPSSNSSTLPTAIWWRDVHEYALPFTLPPTSFDMHLTAPLYLRGGPKGTIASISVTLEQPELVPEGATNDHTWLQYVHRLHSLYSYEPINTNITTSTNHTSHSHHTLSSLFGSSHTKGSSFTSLPSLTSSGSNSPRDEALPSWDEQILRVRWSPDGRNTLASFASGIVRTWDITAPDHPTAAMVLPTIDSNPSNTLINKHHDNANPKLSKSKSNSSVHELENLSTWAAMDFLCLSASARVLAVAGAPLSIFDNAARSNTGTPTANNKPVSQTSKVGHAPVGLESGGMLHVTPVVLQETIIGGSLNSSSPGSLSDTSINSLFHQISGYGINLFDLRVGNTPYATAAPYPDFAGINVLCFDEASLSLIGGGVDGSLLVYDIRMSVLRAKVPGVPIVPLILTDKPSPVSTLNTVINNNDVLSNKSTGNSNSYSTQLARGTSYFSMIDNNMDTLSRTNTLISPSDNTINMTNSSLDINYGFGHAGSITVITTHPTHRILITGGEDGDIHLWSLPDLLHRATLPHVHTPRNASDNHMNTKRKKDKAINVTNPTTSSTIIPNTKDIVHSNDNLEYANKHHLVKNNSTSNTNTTIRKAGISSIAVTEEHIISAGYDGSIYAIPQRW